MKPGEPQKPIVYVLHGDDSLAMARFVEELQSRMGDAATADLNTSRLDGRHCSRADLLTAAGAPPFLAERRLVILTQPLAPLTTADARQRFLELLNALPPTTALVLLIEDALERRRWRAMPENHWLRQWVEKAGHRALLRTFSLPQVGAMPRWIQEQAKAIGGRFSPAASQALASLVGSDTRLAYLEIDKLLNYVNFERPVEAQDVEKLTASGGQADIFEMVDAAAAGNASTALRALHQLIETQEAISLFGMLIRQFRLLLLAREILEAGGAAAEVQRSLGLHSFVAEKLTRQARHFSLNTLKTLYHRLLEIDVASKTGGMELELALDVLLTELNRENTH
ncbi:MAG: DNA polymerase III subunit delta [Anaerolineaceae bacterium]|nr:DNA polymerase III subunit delta [Anaerolineaceae bacterium]